MGSRYIALTRAVPPTIHRCELTHQQRVPIDPARAEREHRKYERALAALGCRIERVAAAPELADSVFVEDAAVVLPEIAIITHPGAESRWAETEGVAAALRPYRPLTFIRAPATLDGGDVLRIDRRIWVGTSGRTNREGIAQIREIAAPFGYSVEVVELLDCLHLKTAVTQVSGDTVLLNPQWVAGRAFEGMERITVDPEEPTGANALLVGESVVYPAGFPRTRERIEARGLDVTTVEVGELAKAEAGVTCCSILIEQP
jgi:dimethylargininase